MKRLLLLSNSTMPGEPFFTWPREELIGFLKDGGPVAFVPYAGISLGFDLYYDLVKRMLDQVGLTSFSLHQEKDPVAALNNAGAIMTGGGNTFCLVKTLHEQGLVKAIREKVLNGIPYVGWSAGANMAGPTMKTTNDMPIVQPASFDAFNLIPYQINPHYTEATLPNQGGESRLDRLKEFAIMNPGVPVACLPEGSLLHVEGDTITVKGKAIRLLTAPEVIKDIASGSTLPAQTASPA
ncbi:MAG: dipeptidase PepE [Flavobacteriales bacterium]|nr:dipeptidase PepE [Flavobacteriales bacterium]MCB9448960.1 dipeptidase PepE [Flavobacteriales bacterium]